MSTTDIFVDDREIASPLFACLKNYPRLCVTVKRLSVGDYQLGEKIIFERKTVFDFARSIIDGRLFHQASRLAASSMRGVLLLEGTAHEVAQLGVQRESMQGALITVNVVLGIPVLRSQNAEESVRLMLYTMDQVTTITKHAIPRHVYRPKGKRKVQLHILQGLPGIGPKRAGQLLKKFRSVKNVMNADMADLTTLATIGEKTASRIRWAVE